MGRPRPGALRAVQCATPLPRSAEPTRKGAVAGGSPERVQPDATSPYEIDARLVVKALVGLAVLLGLSYLCGVLLRDPIVEAGRWALQTFGLGGLFVGSMITDASPLPMTNEPLMLLALSGGEAPRTIFLVVSCASVTAGFVGYTCGRLVGRALGLGAFIGRRYPGFDAFMKRWGAWGVAICAFLPIPFALSTWSAGMTRVELHKVMAATLVRFPKTGFYLWLIVQGWGMGGS